MKVLISAIACNPYLGSENYFGWAAVKCLAQDHDVWVITGSRNRQDLCRAQHEGLIPSNLRFVYAGNHKEWNPNAMKARMQSWMGYINFTKESLRIAQELHHAERFEVVQHVTFSTWRVASPMWKLDIPFVLGPICGNERFPFRLLPTLSLTGAAFELLRKASSVISRCSPSVRRSIRRAAHIFTITQEAEDLVAAMRGSKQNCSPLSSGFYSAARVAEFSRFVAQKNVNGVLRLYAAGNLGGQKCIGLALQALVRVKKQGLDFRYHLGASGPEIPHLKKMVTYLGLTKEVIFGGSLSREDYQRELGDTHIYLLPSMRETVGLTMMEAMMAGCVPIVADNGGPSRAVAGDCGYKIPVSSPDRMVEDVAKAIISVNGNRNIISEMGARASHRIAMNYTEENYRRTVNAIYLKLVSCKENIR